MVNLTSLAKARTGTWSRRSDKKNPRKQMELLVRAYPAFGVVQGEVDIAPRLPRSLR